MMRDMSKGNMTEGMDISMDMVMMIPIAITTIIKPNTKKAILMVMMMAIRKAILISREMSKKMKMIGNYAESCAFDYIHWQ